MLSFVFSYCYTECHYAERRNAECRVDVGMFEKVFSMQNEPQHLNLKKSNKKT